MTLGRSSNCRTVPAPGLKGRGAHGFSLVELLVVIGIIGVLAAIGLPALRGLGESNSIDAATRQLVDDLGYARLRAINDRTTVYVLFVPPNVESQATNLAPYRYTGYTLFSRRGIGEQPGKHHPRQLIPWRTLPDKTFFAPGKFLDAGNPVTTNILDQSFAWTNTFPLTVTNRLFPGMGMYYLAFNAQGQVVRYDGAGRQITGRDEFIPVVKGSVFHPTDSQGQFTGAADLVEIPKGNRRYIRVNWLTGRTQVLGDLLTTDGGAKVITGQPE